MNNDIKNSANERRKGNIVNLVKRGKVSNIYDFNGLVFETSNRLSVFDRVILDDVPLKGQMLNCISQNNKILLEKEGIKTDYIKVPNYFYRGIGFGNSYKSLRFSKRLIMLPFEFIVRNYITGSAWKAYSKGEPYCGITFPAGLHNGDKLSEPVVTVTTKEETGHDRPITKEEVIETLAIWLVDEEVFDGTSYDYLVNNTNTEKVYFTENHMEEELDDDNLIHLVRIPDVCWNFANRYTAETDDDCTKFSYMYAYCLAYLYVNEVFELSLKAFSILSARCKKQGILFIDSKFEFGIDELGNLILADEVGTPDSSRFSSEKNYEETGSIHSMDKQIVRDYCKSIGFTGDSSQEIPKISEEIVKQLTDTYVEIATILFGEKEVRKYL